MWYYTQMEQRKIKQINGDSVGSIRENYIYRKLFFFNKSKGANQWKMETFNKCSGTTEKFSLSFIMNLIPHTKAN